MLKNVNENINVNNLENLMTELEARPEFLCCGNKCGAEATIPY